MGDNNYEMVNVIAKQFDTTTMYLKFSRKMGCIADVFVAPNDDDNNNIL